MFRLNKKFKSLIDFLLIHKPTLSLSFVTNGTLIDTEIIHKLKQFSSCDIEVSLESINKNNDYIRQGSNTTIILKNIDYLIAQQTDNFRIVLRSVPQLLNINNYDQYIRYAWHNRVSIQGIPLMYPKHLQISVLPKDLRFTFIKQYQLLQKELDDNKPEFTTIVTGRNTKGLEQQLSRECQSIIQMLLAEEPEDIDNLQKELCQQLLKWDREFNFDAREYYPEYQSFLEKIGYDI